MDLIPTSKCTVVCFGFCKSRARARARARELKGLADAEIHLECRVNVFSSVDWKGYIESKWANGRCVASSKSYRLQKLYVEVRKNA